MKSATDRCLGRFPEGLFRFALLCSLLPALCFAQKSEGVTSRSVLDELKSIRASLERLEKGQKALLALTSVQMDERRMTALEERRLRLSLQEKDLNNQIAAASAPMSATDGVMSDGRLATEASLARSHVEQSSKALKEVNGAQQTVEQEIAKLQARIATMEKYIEDALR